MAGPGVHTGRSTERKRPQKPAHACPGGTQKWGSGPAPGDGLSPNACSVPAEVREDFVVRPSLQSESNTRAVSLGGGEA